MVERMCPECRFGNAVDAHFCAKCGAPLERLLPAPSKPAALVIAGQRLPITWQQVGKTVAIGAAALVAEAGLAWLRRRIEAPAPGQALAPRPQSDSQAARSIVTIVSQRVIEVVEDQAGRRTISDSQVWRKIE